MTLELLAGRFRYRPCGLLDRSHVQFFTKRSIYELFESAGYVIAELSRIELDAAATEFHTKLTDYPPEVVQFALGRDESRTYQFIIKAYSSTDSRAWAALRTKLEAETTHLRQQLEATRGLLCHRETQIAQLARQIEGTLAARSFFDARLEIAEPFATMRTCATWRIVVRLTRHSAEAWPATGEQAVCLSYHWLDATGVTVVYDGLRTSSLTNFQRGNRSL